MRQQGGFNAEAEQQNTLKDAQLPPTLPFNHTVPSVPGVFPFFISQMSLFLSREPDLEMLGLFPIFKHLID